MHCNKRGTHYSKILNSTKPLFQTYKSCIRILYCNYDIYSLFVFSTFKQLKILFGAWINLPAWKDLNRHTSDKGKLLLKCCNICKISMSTTNQWSVQLPCGGGGTVTTSEGTVRYERNYKS